MELATHNPTGSGGEPLLQKERLWGQALPFNCRRWGDCLLETNMLDSTIALFLMLMQQLLRLQIVDTTSQEVLAVSEVRREVLEN